MKTVNLTEEEHAELLALRSKKTTKASAPATSDVVRAAGTSEGAKKGWLDRANHANSLSVEAHKATSLADESDTREAHSKAETLNFAAENAHKEAAEVATPDRKAEHDTMAGLHGRRATFHQRSATSAKASDTTQSEVIHCRSHASAAGSVLAAEKAWNAGEPVEFMWMPAGRHTICAGFRNGSIELTVNCDENTAANVQASLDTWRTERPKQEPFGCVEHREHEASVRVSAQQAFSFKNDGVYIAAEPTALGAQNVNGKVHRSWSPSFTTDADYSAAKTVKTASGATVMVFPEGVRGSRSNPAEITGVDFCVGTLTNKPAFHAMSPVKSSESTGTLVTLHDGTQLLYENGELVAETNVTVEKTITASDAVKATWSDAARVAAAHAREVSRLAHEEPLKRSTDGKPRADAEAYGVTKQAHAASKKTKQSEIDGNGAGIHMDSHNYAAYMHTEAAKAHKKAGDSFMSELHTKAAAAHREATSELWKENNKASDPATGDQVHAHCAHILLQDVPDATAAEIACYDKCIDEGGSHITAVTEIKSQRKPEHVTQKATLAGVYEKANEPIKAAWSDEARKAAAEARKRHGLDGAKFEHTPEHFAKNASYHEAMAEHHEEEYRLDPTDRRVADTHGELIDLHSRAAFHYEHAAKAAKKGLHDLAGNHLRSAERYGIDADDHYRGPAKASESISPDSIYAALEQRTAAANAVATEAGVISVDDVYEKVTGGAVKATWSDAAREAAIAAKKEHAKSASLEASKVDQNWTSNFKTDSDYRNAAHKAHSIASALHKDAGNEEEAKYHSNHAEHHLLGEEYAKTARVHNKTQDFYKKDSLKEKLKDISQKRKSLRSETPDIKASAATSGDQIHANASDALDLESIYARAGANR